MREKITESIEKNGPGTAAQVGQWIGCETGTAAAILDSMVERGELRRDLIDEGRHSYHLYSTAQGRRDQRGRLVISRKVGQSISIHAGEEEISVVLIDIDQGRARFSVIASKEIRIFRDELLRGESS